MAENQKPAGRSLRPIQRDRLSGHQFAAELERYEKMPSRRCGTWGLKLPAISLGAWETFGGYRGPEMARECIFHAFNLGIAHFDFANNYSQPPGRAETVVGRVRREMPREELIISTKYLQNVPDESRAARLWTEEQRRALLPERRLAQVRKLNEIAQSRGQTRTQMALVWTLRDPAVTSALSALRGWRKM